MGGWPRPDLVGRRFNSWLVLERVSGKGPTFWLCRCDCGTERKVAHCNLYHGRSTNCGCTAYWARQMGRNHVPHPRDRDLPDEFWCSLLEPINDVYVQVSTCGRIRHASTGHVYCEFSEGGYSKIMLRGLIRKVHRIVATAFHPNPLNLSDVNHKDGKKRNNVPSNLEWRSHAGNMDHAWKTGLCQPRPGSKNPAAKLTEEDVIRIRERYIPGVIKQSELAAEYGVSQAVISLITRREKWIHV